MRFINNDWHFLLLIIFFITHGYADFTGLVPPVELFVLLLVLILIAFLFYKLGKPIFKNARKAALFVTFFMTVFLFFGAFQDFLGSFRISSAIAQLKVFFPLSLLIILLGFFLLKKSSGNFRRLTIFLNVLFVLYILADLAVITVRLISPDRTKVSNLNAKGLKPEICDSCEKPSVYFIVLDEYSGSDALKAYFNYDNSSFEQNLAKEGFKVNRGTTSNYVYTVFSMASMLNMEYLKGLGKQAAENHFGYRKATRSISDNVVVNFFKHNGYRINNYSYFQLPDVPPGFKTDYLPGELALITHRTMYSRVAKEAVRIAANKLSLTSFQERSEATFISNNESMLKRALDESAVQGKEPSFTYLHLMMPHDPIAFDSTGNRIEPFWQRRSFTKKDVDEAYLQYLVYTNNRIYNFIKSLKENTAGKAIIMLVSDHGYRGSRMNDETKWRYHSLSAIYLPRQNYQHWYDGISNVNQFRALLNSSFGQQLPILKDSLVY
ncbi:MAG TPA: sulfatase-like hydrolase/transferase [Chitinophagaceae bacterium]